MELWTAGPSGTAGIKSLATLDQVTHMKVAEGTEGEKLRGRADGL